MSLRRLLAIFRKELLHIVRDSRNLFLVVFSPAILLFLLANVFSFDVGQIRLAILDLDRTVLSRRYLAELGADPDLTLAYSVGSYDEALPLLVSDDIDAAVVIPPGFAAAVQGGRSAKVQLIIDGADPFAGGEAMRSLEARTGVFVLTAGALQSRSGGQPVEIRTQAWYNSGLESLLSMVPGLLPVVLIMPTMALALALAREKEAGTLEGLVATPISGLEYLAGKLLAYILMALCSALLALLVAVMWFKVPFRASLLDYLLLSGSYFLACMGAAIVVASFVKSQQTAMFIVLLIFIVPSFFLTGLTTPISAESLAARLTSYALPSTHFVESCRAIFLKGLGVRHLARQALVMLGMGIGAIVIGLALFRKKVA